MAISLGFRFAFWCVTESAVCRQGLLWGAAGGQTYIGSIEHGVEYAYDHFTRRGTAAEIQTGLDALYSPEENPGWVVTDFAAPFELRKLQWRLSRQPGGATEDQDVMTFHFIKASGGVPGSYVDGTDLPAVESALNSCYTSLKTYLPSYVHNDQYRWYKDGPAFYELNSEGTAYVPLATGNPAIRVTEVDVAGTGSGVVLPPQSAMTVSEISSARKHWGRFYLPAPVSTVADANGYIASTSQTNILGYFVTFYNACRAASMIPVVFSIQKPDRLNSRGHTLPAVPAVAYEVLSLQMDNLFDVIRSRRYDSATNKLRTTLT